MAHTYCFVRSFEEIYDPVTLTEMRRQPLCLLGWGNGYVAVPEGHPWYGIDYNDIDIEIHGGLTYGSFVDWGGGVHASHYVVGFDTGHYQDNLETCPESYVRSEAKKLLQLALDAAKRHENDKP